MQIFKFTFGIALTLLLFGIFYLLRNRKIFSKIPIIFSVGICIILILEIFNISYETYYTSAKFLSYIIAPATLAFAYPLYENSDILFKNKRVLYPALLIGTVVAIISTYLCAMIFHAQLRVLMSMLPKSTTMPVAVEISKSIGGILELTACVVVITGVLGAVSGHRVLKKFRVKNDIAIGLAMGSASHVIGTAACAEKQKSKQAAAGTIALILVGVLSAVLIPAVEYFVRFFQIGF